MGPTYHSLKALWPSLPSDFEAIPARWAHHDIPQFPQTTISSHSDVKNQNKFNEIIYHLPENGSINSVIINIIKMPLGGGGGLHLTALPWSPPSPLWSPSWSAFMCPTFAVTPNLILEPCHNQIRLGNLTTGGIYSVRVAGASESIYNPATVYQVSWHGLEKVGLCGDKRLEGWGGGEA